MANGTTAGMKSYDNRELLLHRLTGGFFGIALGGMLCRRLPSIVDWLAFLGLLGLVFAVLAKSRSNEVQGR